MTGLSLRSVTDKERDWVERFIIEHWGSDLMIAHGQAFYISQLPGILAEIQGEVVGFVSYSIGGDQCEITSIDSLRAGLGIGTALIEAVKAIAIQSGCRRLFLITTNDNTPALRFYQRRGFILAALHKGAVLESRKIKPEIPLTGIDDIPIRDEIELEIDLNPDKG